MHEVHRRMESVRGPSGAALFHVRANILRLRPVGDQQLPPKYPLLGQRLFGYGGFFPNFRMIGHFRIRIPSGRGLGYHDGQRKDGGAVGLLSWGAGVVG